MDLPEDRKPTLFAYWFTIVFGSIALVEFAVRCGWIK
jgi:hypothetical protein